MFLTGDAAVVPMSLLHNIRHNQVLHQKVVLLTVRTQDIPYVGDAAGRGREAGQGLLPGRGGLRLHGRARRAPALERCRAHAVPVDLAATSYFVARETLIPSPRPS